MFGFVSAAASRWETGLCLFERTVMWEEGPLQSVLQQRARRQRRARSRGSGDK